MYLWLAEKSQASLWLVTAFKSYFWWHFLMSDQIMDAEKDLNSMLTAEHCCLILRIVIKNFWTDYASVDQLYFLQDLAKVLFINNIDPKSFRKNALFNLHQFQNVCSCDMSFGIHWVQAMLWVKGVKKLNCGIACILLPQLGNQSRFTERQIWHCIQKCWTVA